MEDEKVTEGNEEEVEEDVDTGVEEDLSQSEAEAEVEADEAGSDSEDTEGPEEGFDNDEESAKVSLFPSFLFHNDFMQSKKLSREGQSIFRTFFLNTTIQK